MYDRLDRHLSHVVSQTTVDCRMARQPCLDSHQTNTYRSWHTLYGKNCAVCIYVVAMDCRSRRIRAI